MHLFFFFLFFEFQGNGKRCMDWEVVFNGYTWLSTGIIETDFIKYNGTYGSNIQGNVDAKFGRSATDSNVTLTGTDSSKLQSAFGSLRKEEVDVQKLLRDSKGRLVLPACSYAAVLWNAACLNRLLLDNRDNTLIIPGHLDHYKTCNEHDCTLSNHKIPFSCWILTDIRDSLFKVTAL